MYIQIICLLHAGGLWLITEDFMLFCVQVNNVRGSYHLVSVLGQ